MIEGCVLCKVTSEWSMAKEPPTMNCDPEMLREDWCTPTLPTTEKLGMLIEVTVINIMNSTGEKE